MRSINARHSSCRTIARLAAPELRGLYGDPSPHDGVAANNISGKRYEDHLREAGFTVEPPVKNQGKGAAMMRIEAWRWLGSQICSAWDFCTCSSGYVSVVAFRPNFVKY